MKKRSLWFGFLLIALLGLSFTAVFAQDSLQFGLRLRRDWGYGAGADIQGRVTLSLTGETGKLSKVVFYMDDAVMAELNEAPYSFSFSTDNYPSGLRRMGAVVFTSDGASQEVAPISYNFLSQEAANSTATKVIVLAVAVVLISTGLSFFISKRSKASETASGGINGLAVCQQCGKTFPRSFLGLNVVVGKFERCPHCGKWQLTRRASPLEIQLADSRNKPKTDSLPKTKTEKDELEDSKFIDS